MNPVDPNMTPNIIHRIEVYLPDFVVKIAESDFRFLYSCLNIIRLMMKLKKPKVLHGIHSKGKEST